MASRAGNFTVQNPDCLITVGARLDRVLTGYSLENFARGARKVVVDIDRAELGKLGAMRQWNSLVADECERSLRGFRVVGEIQM